MFDKEWGVTENVGGFDSRYLARLNQVNADGTYVYGFNANRPQPLQVYDASNAFPSRVVSRWSVMATVRYEF